MDVSIMIVAWNVRKLLEDCLESVFEQTKGIDFEVVYVDNASEDGSVEMTRERFPEVTIIENDENKGFIKANNQAIEIAKGRYVLLLNSDTIVLDNAIEKMVKFADSHPEAGVIGCKILNTDKTLRRACFLYPSALNMLISATCLQKGFPESKFWGRERMTWWGFDDIREVETVSGCCSLVRHEAIKQVGCMNEIYFVYGDDPDWCYRFKKAGWKVLFTPEPKVIHLGGQTTKLKADKFTLQLYGSKLLFIKQYKSKLSFLMCRIFTASFFGLRVPYWFLYALFSKKHREAAFVKAKTYLLGSIYCLFNWKNLLINKDEVEGLL